MDDSDSRHAAGPGGPQAPLGAVVVAPSTGELAHRVVTALRRVHREVTIVHRGGPGLGTLLDRGASAVYGNCEVPGILGAAMHGASGLVWIPHTATLVDAPETALRAAAIAASTCERLRVPRVVVLSVVGNDEVLMRGPLGVVRSIERAFQSRCSSVTVVRAGLFMDCLVDFVPFLAEHGTLHLPLPPRMALPWVAADDVAAELVARVAATSTPPEVVTMRGPKELDARQIADAIGAALPCSGRLLGENAADAAGLLSSLGISRHRARWLETLWAAAAAGALGSRHADDVEGDATTPIEAWMSGPMSRAYRSHVLRSRGAHRSD